MVCDGIRVVWVLAVVSGRVVTSELACVKPTDGSSRRLYLLGLMEWDGWDLQRLDGRV
jgi:hypothetical protein